MGLFKKLENCHYRIKECILESGEIPTLREQRELLNIAQTCIEYSKQMTSIRKSAKINED